MKATVSTPLRLRRLEFGGPQSLFCIPLVGTDAASLVDQATIAMRLKPDLIEWRADFFSETSVEALVHAAGVLRTMADEPAIIFTLRIKAEGGAQELSQPKRRELI